MVLGILLLLQAGAAAPEPAASDARVLRSARSAQVRFEGTRRMNLPRDRSGSGGSRCDVRIGRFCYWYDSTETPPVPEPERITAARETLLRALDTAAARLPANAWILGQRTRYLIEAGRPAAARAELDDCRADLWWCAALAGLALHAQQAYAAADSAFDLALGAMPPAQRCEWLDIRVLVNDRLARELGRASCAERARHAATLWFVAQPLWITPGSYLKTEHLSRRTMAVILAGSANAHGMAFGPDSRELLIRYGWSEWYTREWPTGYGTTPGITGHDRSPAYAFFPSVESVSAAERIAADGWALHAPVAESRYSPRHVRHLSTLDHHLARLPRGDSVLLAVAYRVADTTLARDALRGAVATAPGTPAQRLAGPAGQLRRIAVVRGPTLVSIEILGDSSRRAARARYTVEPLSCTSGARFCVSDLVLFDPAAGRDTATLEDAMSSAITATQLSVTRPLGVYWETDGATAGGTAANFTLTVEPVRTSAFRRLATRLGLARERTTVRLHWEGTLQADLTRQHVTLRLPDRARGAYKLTLTVQPRGAAPLRAEREVEMIP